jgi:hypothetical protein
MRLPRRSSDSSNTQNAFWAPSASNTPAARTAIREKRVTEITALLKVNMKYVAPVPPGYEAKAKKCENVTNDICRLDENIKFKEISGQTASEKETQTQVKLKAEETKLRESLNKARDAWFDKMALNLTNGKLQIFTASHREQWYTDEETMLGFAHIDTASAQPASLYVKEELEDETAKSTAKSLISQLEEEAISQSRDSLRIIADDDVTREALRDSGYSTPCIFGKNIWQKHLSNVW